MRPAVEVPLHEHEPGFHHRHDGGHHRHGHAGDQGPDGRHALAESKQYDVPEWVVVLADAETWVVCSKIKFSGDYLLYTEAKGFGGTGLVTRVARLDAIAFIEQVNPTEQTP